MKISSKSFKHLDTLPKTHVFNGLNAGGDNISPDLLWEDFPSNTKSFALVCHDPDAPKENGWYHWLVINIPKEINSFLEGEKIKYKELLTDFLKTGYDGAAPPVGHGIHHYNFTIYALDVEELDIDTNTLPKKSEDIIKSHALDFATITATYQR